MRYGAASGGSERGSWERISPSLNVAPSPDFGCLAETGSSDARFTVGSALNLTGQTIISVDQLMQVPLDPRCRRVLHKRAGARRGGPVIFCGLLLLLPLHRTGGCGNRPRFTVRLSRNRAIKHNTRYRRHRSTASRKQRRPEASRRPDHTRARCPAQAKRPHAGSPAPHRYPQPYGLGRTEPDKSPQLVTRSRRMAMTGRLPIGIVRYCG